MNSIKEVSRCACQLKKSSSFHEQFDPLGNSRYVSLGGGGGLISYKAGKAKQMEKRSARSRLVKQVFFYITK